MIDFLIGLSIGLVAGFGIGLSFVVWSIMSHDEDDADQYDDEYNRML